MERDPVCGIEVDPQTAAHAEYEGGLFYFCTTQCMDRFLADPEQYIARGHPGTPVAP